MLRVMPDKMIKNDFELYREYWERNRDFFGQISHDLEKRLINLEKHSFQFKDIYIEIESAIAALMTSYKSDTHAVAHEFLLMMLAHIRDHREEIEKQQISFNVIHFILKKIRSYEEERFSKFPSVSQSEELHTTSKIKLSHFAENKSFKWITFNRNGSWFVAPYEMLDIVPYRIAPFVVDPHTPENMIEFNDTRYRVNDLFSSTLGSPPPDPSCYIIIQNQKSDCFAADHRGKRYLSSRNFIRNKIEPFRSQIGFASGFIRLGGIRHIYLSLE
jgi:hypothetical protein